MARTTRSTVTLDKQEEESNKPAPKQNGQVKKRKRPVASQDEDQPTAKLVRTEDAKAELPSSDSDHISSRPHVEESISEDQAQRVLDVLQAIDGQGLLDRVFPSTSTSSTSLSLRERLNNSSELNLTSLKNHIYELFPITIQSRSTPSEPAAQQLRFCQLALELLEQAKTRHLPLDELSNISDPPEKAVPSETNPPPAVKYALLQHLPQGEYWSSFASSKDDIPDPSSFRTGHAELVAIVPEPAVAAADVPRLGSYHTKALPVYKDKLPKERRATVGSFLDYGPWQSFAPAFNHEGTEIGRRQLGEVAYGRQMHYGESSRLTEADAMDCDSPEVVPARIGSQDLELEGLFSEEDIKSIKQALESEELELATQELLDRNSRALQRLQSLQWQRLAGADDQSRTIEEGSEEYELAQGIVESLAVLTALRPRSSTNGITPASSALRTLQRTLPTAATHGWRGSLPPSSAPILRDNSTVKVQPVPASAPPAPVAPSTPAAGTTSFSGYSYPYNQQRGAASTNPATPYKANNGYYPPVYGQPAQQGGYYASATPAYTASNYNYYNTFSAGGNGAAAQQAAPATTYSHFFSSVAATPANARGTPVVGNTVLGKQPTPGGFQQPTLPAHLRGNQPPNAHFGTFAVQPQ